MIESSQLLSAWWGSLHSRSFDVTDLITNTFGGLIGYLIL
nr:VanZ family protein [Brevibacillus laterosporus]